MLTFDEVHEYWCLLYQQFQQDKEVLQFCPDEE